MNHEVLLHKLLSFGICQNSFKWFQSYLKGRSQCVKWRGVFSDEKDVTIGVPQGSILGPLFFILFVNDYPKCLKHSNVSVYADDTSQDVSHSSIDVIEQRLYEDLLNSMRWMENNKLTMNLKKTQCMLIGTTQRLSKCRKLCIKVGDIVLETVRSAKLLGVQIDECLTWSAHIDSLCKKLSQKIGILRRLQAFMSPAALLKVFNCIIFPHFNYCCTVWCSAKNKVFIDRLFKLQKRASRIILKVKVTQTPTADIFRVLKWMPIHDYFIYRKMVLTFKVLKNLTPEYLNVFTFVHQISTRTTRNSENGILYIPRFRTEYFKRSFKVSSTLLWNELPESIRNCDTLSSFKSAYLQHFNTNK